MTLEDFRLVTYVTKYDVDFLYNGQHLTAKGVHLVSYEGVSGKMGGYVRGVGTAVFQSKNAIGDYRIKISDILELRNSLDNENLQFGNVCSCRDNTECCFMCQGL